MEENGKDDECERPRDVNVVEFVKGRVRQIAELIQAIGNRALVAGEVTKGPRTAIQRLPRHMRRRAMSYNVKRLPRAQRRFAKSAIAASKHRKKPPSRFWRRRPRNLLLNYIRRQRKRVWLETHIWHAKRFRMVEKWGYKLPLCSYQRAFRPSYRDAMRHCVVRDASFLRCFQICGADQQAIIEPLRKLCAPEVGPSFAFKAALDGRFEMPVLLYEPGQYPHGFIAPIRFLWSKNRNDGSCILAIWTHPSSSNAVLSKLVSLLNLKKRDQAPQSSQTDKVPSSVDEWRLRSLQIRTDVYESEEGLKLLDLSDQLIRFRLHGPKSCAILDEVLAVVDEKESKEPWMNDFLSVNQSWKNEWSKHSPGEFSDGTVLTLLVEDPRLTRPLRKTKPDESSRCSAKSLSVNDLPLPLHTFWDFEIRKKALEKKMSEAELQKKRSTQLQPVKTSKAKIPILLVMRNTGRGTTNPLIGLDLLVPSGFGLEFWLALQYGTARSIALRDQKFLEFESGHFNFPADVPDSPAGLTEFKEEYISLQEKYIRRPHNRRIKYWNNLSVKYPFTFQFTELVHSWLNDSDSGDRAYVIRDRRLLLAIDKWLAGKGASPEDSLLNSAAMVPVCLTSTTTGRPLRFALICAPTDEDFTAAKNLSEEEKAVKIAEQPRASSSKSANLEDEREKKAAEQTKKVEIEDFIPLDVEVKEKLISLDSLFPDKEFIRKRRMKEKKKERREKAKAAKRLKITAGGDAQTSAVQQSSDTAKLEGQEVVQSVKYNTSCSRQIIGRVVRGDYSFSRGKGFAIGYCCLPALKLIRRGQVLFRNTTSKYYHPARIAVLKSQLDL